jgi:hypothetical protein
MTELNCGTAPRVLEGPGVLRIADSAPIQCFRQRGMRVKSTGPVGVHGSDCRYLRRCQSM